MTGSAVEFLVARLVAIVQGAGSESSTGPGSASRLESWEWHERRQALTLRFGTAGPGPREVEVWITEAAAAAYTDGRMDRDVRDVWGPGLGAVEGAARFASVHLEEFIGTADGPVLRCELTADGLRRRES